MTSTMIATSFMVEIDPEQVRFWPNPLMWVCPPHKKWVHGYGVDEKAVLNQFLWYEQSD